MSVRLLTQSFLAASLAVAGTCSQAPAQTNPPLAQPATACVQRVYSVADLVIPIADSANINLHDLVKVTEFEKLVKQAAGTPKAETATTIQTSAPPKTRHDELIRLLVTTVEPESWASKEGSATVDYHSLGMALVVNATPAHQEKIAAVLANLRRQQDAQVAVEIRIISAAEPTLERIGIDVSASPASAPTVLGQPGAELLRNSVQGFPKVTFLNDAEVYRLLEATQNDPRTNVMQAPKVTAFNGQAVNFSCVDLQYFVTHVNTVQANNSVIYVPQNEPMPKAGYYFSILPTISGDRRFVNLNLKANMTNLVSGAVPLYPVTAMITPIFEGGAQGQPVPFTQFLQQPSFNTMTVDRRLTLPDGGTALISGWRRTTETHRDEFGPPVLSKIPYINRLFRNASYDRGTEHVMLMVTPRIVIQTEAEKAAMADAASKIRAASQDTEEETAATLLAKYRQACAEGRLADAKALAVKALALDPACFSGK